MGRLFVIDLEEPVYRCKHCKVEFAVYEDPITRMPALFEYPVIHVKLYYFSKCFNVVVGTNEVMIENTENENGNPMFEEGVEIVMYNEGNFLINRFKLNGPPDGSDDDPYPGRLRREFRKRGRRIVLIEECKAGLYIL